MGSDIALWQPDGTEIRSTTERQCSRACIPQYFSSNNTPLHIPVTPGWFKTLPIVIIVLSVVIFAYNYASIAPPVQIVVAAGTVTVITASGALAIRICAVGWYCYYANLTLDVLHMILWIVSLAAGVYKLNEAPQDALDHASKTGPTTSMIVLLALIIIELTFVSTQTALSVYYIYAHRQLGRHSTVLRDRNGNIMTKDEHPTDGMWELNTFSEDVEDRVPSPVEVHDKRRPVDRHAIENPLPIDPLRMSPYEGPVAQPPNPFVAPEPMVTRPPSCFIAPEPMGNLF